MQTIIEKWTKYIILRSQKNLWDFSRLKEMSLPLTGVAQWAGHHPTSQKISDSIPSQGTGLGCRLVPGWGMRETSNQCFSHMGTLTFLSVSLSLPLSPKINKQNLKKKKKKQTRKWTCLPGREGKELACWWRKRRDRTTGESRVKGPSCRAGYKIQFSQRAIFCVVVKIILIMVMYNF